MFPSFQEILLSPQFTFLVGEAKEKVVVSTVVIAALSEPLDRLINGPMREAREKCAELPDVDKEDFIRLCEFVHRGYYTVPKPEKGSPGYAKDEISDGNSSDGARQRPEEISQWYNPGARKERREAEDYSSPKRRFTRRQYLHGVPRSEFIDQHFHESHNVPDRGGIRDVFLAHAKMYCLGDRYLIEPLKGLSLHKLRDSLCEYRPYCNGERVGDIVSLARFAYLDSHTKDRDQGMGTIDDLRQLVVDSMVITVKSLDESKIFEALLEEGGQFAVDFYRALRVEHQDEVRAARKSGSRRNHVEAQHN